MVTANTIVESLATSCRQFDAVPDEVTYATVMLDSGGEHSNVSLPIVEFTVEDITRVTSRNTEKTGVVVDETGAEVGYNYTQWFDLTVTALVQTVPQTSTTHRELAQLVRRTLYRHDSHGPSQSLPDPNDIGSSLSDISYVAVGDAVASHDFAMSPSLRARSITLDIKFEHSWSSVDLGVEYEQVDAIDPINVVVE
jgi:hypothetical protein